MTGVEAGLFLLYAIKQWPPTLLLNYVDITKNAHHSFGKFQLSKCRSLPTQIQKIYSEIIVNDVCRDVDVSNYVT